MAAAGYDYETVTVEIAEPKIAVLTFNRPEQRNCISPDLSRDMVAVLDQLAADDDVRTVVITGSGKAFCAGMDLKVFYENREKPGKEWSPEGLDFGTWMRKLRELPKPTIAAVNGHAYGGGFMVISMCDMAVASEKAQVGLSEINWGSPPGGGATRATIDMMLPKQANYLLYTGNTIDGREMERTGFVNRTVAHEDLMEAAMELARVVAKHHPVPLKWMKRQILGSRQIPDFDLGVEYEGLILSQMRNYDGYTGSHDGWKGFIDKEYRPGLEAKEFAD